MAMGTLHLVREEDPNTPGREWLLPAISAKGASTEYALGDDTRWVDAPCKDFWPEPPK